MALIKTGEQYLRPLRIVSVVNDINNRRKKAMAGRIAAALGGEVDGKRIALLGLTFKPNTDDMREAPSLDIISNLTDMGAQIRVFDPVGMDASRAYLKDVEYAKDAYDCAEGADALVIVTEWDEFRALSLGKLKAALKRPIIIDLRNIYRPDKMQAAGFAYHSIGRTTAAAQVRSFTANRDEREKHVPAVALNGVRKVPMPTHIQLEEQLSSESKPSTRTEL